MLYVDIQFPPRLALNSQRNTAWSTTLNQTFSGIEAASQNWSQARHEFDVSFAVRTASDYETVLNHFHAVRAKSKAFPFRDCLDYRVEASNGVLSIPAESPTVGFQMQKRYGTGANAYYRDITKPKLDTVFIWRTRASVVDDITASCAIGQYTGIVSIPGGVYLPGDVLAWSGQFYVPCRYDTDQLPAVIQDRRPGGGDYLVACESIPIVEVKRADIA